MERDTTFDDFGETDWTEVFTSDDQKTVEYGFNSAHDFITGEAEQNQHQLTQTLLQEVDLGQSKSLGEIWLSINNIFHIE